MLELTCNKPSSQIKHVQVVNNLFQQLGTCSANTTFEQLVNRFVTTCMNVSLQNYSSFLPTCALPCFPGLCISYSAISCATLEYDLTNSLSIPSTIFFVSNGFDSFSIFFPAYSPSLSLLPVEGF